MTAEEALSKAMDGLEDGYSRHQHKEIVAATLAALAAAGFVVVPVSELERIAALGDVDADEGPSAARALLAAARRG